MTSYKHFTSKLTRIRIDSNLTKCETAARCRINYATYSRIEQGKCDITIGLINALSDSLDVSFSELMGIEMNQIPKFSCYENRIVTEDMEEVRTWGIAVRSKANAVLSESGTFTFYYSHLTTEKDELVNLVDLMNQEHIELVHVEDVIEDFLAELR